ncbi:hypothetical protein ES319_A09G102500v1 [Gossypium barbadense]|uniref:Transcription repressor n=2 Tax=Gossypium TaxID=3633 RepID=A0A2P5WHM9_GOSBA|nr:hypothetical protein ES319_A09G102500v1 [Gossypium barbadense]PPR90590.1 hypothetical protein GOBAR_AA30097 [Gossypium barbadense]TYH02225.1 hypothetical protein ES288_A09G122400v1 [Gossypium darwinii]
MSSNKKNLFKSLLTVNAGCGCSKPKLSDAYEPKPKSKSSSAPRSPINNALPTIENDDLTSTSFSFNNEDTLSSSPTTTDLYSESEPDLPTAKLSRPCPKIIDSVAVVKDSDDPYKDFRHSMLQMIVEKRIYSKHDLEELLQCFLELNSPCHHDVIIKAFMEIRKRVLPDEIVIALQDQEPSFVHGGEKPGS